MVRHNNREHKGIIRRTSVVRYTDQQPDRNDNVNMMLVVIKINIDEVVDFFKICWFLNVGQRFSPTVLFVMVTT